MKFQASAGRVTTGVVRSVMAVPRTISWPCATSVALLVSGSSSNWRLCHGLRITSSCQGRMVVFKVAAGSEPTIITPSWLKASRVRATPCAVAASLVSATSVE